MNIKPYESSGRYSFDVENIKASFVDSASSLAFMTDRIERKRETVKEISRIF